MSKNDSMLVDSLRVMAGLNDVPLTNRHRANLNSAARVLEAALDLHGQVQIRDRAYCRECWTVRGDYVLWPCRTARVLGVES